MKYTVTIGERTFEVEVNGDRVVVNGAPRTVELSAIPHTPLSQLVVDGERRTLAVARDGDGWSVQHRGWTVRADVEDQRSREIREMTGEGAARHKGGTVRAPMPGMVLRVEVERGQSVDAGAGIVVLEAMKMENEIRATVGGVVRAIHVTAGDAVEKGALLVELGDEP